MSLNFQYLINLAFRIAVSSYFIACGINWQQSPNQTYTLLQKNIATYEALNGLVIDPWFVTAYAHLSVVIGTVLLFRMRIGKYLGILALIINQIFLSQANELIFIGIKIIMVGTLMTNDFKRK